MKDYVYDIETYPNCFTMSVTRIEDGFKRRFEISDFKDEQFHLRLFLHWLRNNDCRMVGFNNIGFDYPVIHLLITSHHVTAFQLYEKAIAIINGDRFEHLVWQSDHYVPQLDLYKIHHFDNMARATSLKVLEFNMRSENIEDLPFPVGVHLNEEQIEALHEYNEHDVDETVKFYIESLPMIEMREELSIKYNKNFLNHNDTKIGKDYFIMRLEQEHPGSCYVSGTRNPRQTIRPRISLSQCIFPYIRFQEPEFNRIKSWLEQQTITETKGAFKDLSCVVNGFTFVFGLGGIHGSLEFREIHADNEYEIIDLDVASYYPNLAIANRVHPEHLGDEFCDIYKDVYEERKKHKKGTVENAMFKLALNGVYGDSNNQYSPFYDPQYTMTITLNGQLLLCMLAEWLMVIEGLEMIQVNTDGLTVKCPRSKRDQVDTVKAQWEQYTLLELEAVNYSRMFIRDVNNYIGEYVDGGLKRKGAYEYKREWHQNQSALVVPKAVEANLIHGVPIREFIMGHPDLYDFMLRVKLPRTMRLVIEQDGQQYPLQNITRYYVSTIGGHLKKIMPPLKGKTEERVREIESGWMVVPCNDIKDATVPIKYDYYIQEAEKLTLGMR